VQRDYGSIAGQVATRVRHVGHYSWVVAKCISSGQNRLLWQVATGHETSAPKVDVQILSVAFHPDWQRLAGGGLENNAFVLTGPPS
jgi:hypothetical protein